MIVGGRAPVLKRGNVTTQINSETSDSTLDCAEINGGARIDGLAFSASGSLSTP